MNKLKQLLQSRNLSQSDLLRLIEAKTGVTTIKKANLSNMINGKQGTILLSTAQLIAQALDVSIDDITD